MLGRLCCPTIEYFLRKTSDKRWFLAKLISKREEHPAIKAIRNFYKKTKFKYDPDLSDPYEVFIKLFNLFVENYPRAKSMTSVSYHRLPVDDLYHAILGDLCWSNATENKVEREIAFGCVLHQLKEAGLLNPENLTAIKQHENPMKLINVLSTFKYWFNDSNIYLTQDIFNIIQNSKKPKVFTDMLITFKRAIELLEKNNILTPENLETIGNLYKKVNGKYHDKLHYHINIYTRSEYKNPVEKIGYAFYELSSTYITKVPVTQEIFDKIINHKDPVKFVKDLIEPKPIVKDADEELFKIKHSIFEKKPKSLKMKKSEPFLKKVKEIKINAVSKKVIVSPKNFFTQHKKTQPKSFSDSSKVSMEEFVTLATKEPVLFFCDEGAKEGINQQKLCTDFEGREKGYFASMQEAVEFMGKNYNTKLTVDFIQQLHAKTVEKNKGIKKDEDKNEKFMIENNKTKFSWLDNSFGIDFTKDGLRDTIEMVIDLLNQSSGIKESRERSYNIFGSFSCHSNAFVVFSPNEEYEIGVVAKYGKNVAEDYIKHRGALPKRQYTADEPRLIISKVFIGNNSKDKIGIRVWDPKADRYRFIDCSSSSDKNFSFADDIFESRKLWKANWTITFSLKEREVIVKGIIKKYNEQITKRKTPAEKLSLIFKTAKLLLLTHPFADGNSRTFFMLLMQQLLIKNGLSPFALTFNPNHFDGYSNKKCVSMIKEGQKKYQEILSSSLKESVTFEVNKFKSRPNSKFI